MWQAPSWLDSSVGRALHRYHRGHGFESRSGLNFFQTSMSQCLLSCVYNCDGQPLFHIFLCNSNMWSFIVFFCILWSQNSSKPIGYFRIALYLLTSLHEKPFIWKWVLPTASFSCKSNLITFIRKVLFEESFLKQRHKETRKWSIQCRRKPTQN